MITGILKLAGMANIYILGDSMNSKIAERRGCPKSMGQP